MPLKLYKMDLSPPACAAMMICEIHNVPVEMIELNLMEKEHLTPEYLKKNPMHTVPMLEDEDLYIHDSHVILTYLTDKYGKDDSLYPKDLKKRARVDQMIYFDALFFFRMRNISMPLKLYKMDLSPPACAAMMICEIHNVPVEMIELNLMEKEHLTPEYLKKNPMHTVPMLEDEDLYIHDSHVILTYLTDKYGKDDSLYPKDLKKRARVDQMIYFDALFFFRMRNISYPAIFEGVRQPPEKVLNAVREAYDFLEAFLNKSKFVAADHMTVADVSLVATVAAASYAIPIDDKKYPKIKAWFSYMEKQPFYQKRTAAGTAKLKEILQQHLDL